MRGVGIRPEQRDGNELQLGELGLQPAGDIFREVGGGGVGLLLNAVTGDVIRIEFCPANPGQQQQQGQEQHGPAQRARAQDALGYGARHGGLRSLMRRLFRAGMRCGVGHSPERVPGRTQRPLLRQVLQHGEAVCGVALQRVQRAVVAPPHGPITRLECVEIRLASVVQHCF
jgi:hypothetical protein